MKALFRLRSLLFFLPVLLLSGCFEIVEDVTVHNDGTGTFMYTVNMSMSKDRLDNIMKLDSSDGYRVPKKSELENQILKAKNSFVSSQGITNVATTSDWVNYIFTIKFDFNSVNNLNLALELVSAELTADHKRIPEASDNFNWTGTAFDRKSNYDAAKSSPKLTPKDKEILKDATYTCIYRFDSPVKSNSNADAKISKSGKSVMMKMNLLQLATGQKSIANKIALQ
ncbi:MAG TPA: hypothetical protein VL651_11840 [Bacteroidia bacterium]|jgi:hypothetical protein|nr:hypothetical protein [Bacteroidia bacterium]